MYKRVAGGRGSSPEPSSGAYDAPLDLQVRPRRLSTVVLAPYDSPLWHSSRIAVPKLWLP